MEPRAGGVMFGVHSGKQPEVIGFFMVPSFSMIAFASAIEPLRLANRLSEKALYEWVLISRDGGPVTASNGISVNPHFAMTDYDSNMASREMPTLILVSGVGAEVYNDQDTFGWLRRLDRQGADIGALCTGAHVLARAGLLDDKICTLHWENIPSFRETYPDIEVTDDLFEIDGNRFTCSGGTAALDLMLHLIRTEHDEDLANRVSEECILDRVRGGQDQQRMPLAVRLGVDNRKLIDSIHMMETHLEEPLSQEELAAVVGNFASAAGTVVPTARRSPAKPVLHAASTRPGTEAFAANGHGHRRCGHGLRIRLRLAFREVLPAVLRRNAASGPRQRSLSIRSSIHSAVRFKPPNG